MGHERAIKRLQSQINKLREEHNSLKIDIDVKTNQFNIIGNTINELSQKINQLRKKHKQEKIIKLSEHAVVRYVERVIGKTMSDINEEIITDELKHQVSILGGSGKYPILNNKYIAVMKDYTIITINEA